MEKEKPPAGEATAGGQFLAIKFYASFSGEAVIWLCFRAGVAFLLVRSLAPEERTNNLRVLLLNNEFNI